MVTPSTEAAIFLVLLAVCVVAIAAVVLVVTYAHRQIHRLERWNDRHRRTVRPGDPSRGRRSGWSPNRPGWSPNRTAWR
ncbi:MAG TPA: hypothetical protein VK875_02790 [Euzebyales bacterium]|nr:hypothetical protein [Euzebyales bacterium]